MGADCKPKVNAKAAALNKIFYDMAAEGYEKADGHRDHVPKWLDENIKESNSHECFLDLGAGSGYIAKQAAKYFGDVHAMDISAEMMAKIKDDRIQTVEHDITREWPYSDRIFDKIAAVSVLHHIPDWRPVIEEMDRCLKFKGIFYTDLDLDASFGRHWQCMLALYRQIKAPAKRYARIHPALEDLYPTVEVHSQGIDAREIAKDLEARGYLVLLVYHWGNYKPCRRGLAPYVSIWAEK